MNEFENEFVRIYSQNLEMTKVVGIAVQRLIFMRSLIGGRFLVSRCVGNAVPFNICEDLRTSFYTVTVAHLA